MPITCCDCIRLQRKGGCLTHRLQQRRVYFYTRPDLYGRGEFKVLDSKAGTYRYTRGWKDWRDYLKSEGLREISLKDIKGDGSKQAIKKSEAKFKEAVKKAVPKAINEARYRPWFDKRVIGQGGTFTYSDLKSDMERESIRRRRYAEKDNSVRV